MPLQIYNTLTRRKEEFKPMEKGRVYIYVCGPTVYGDPHIGHAKSYISFDVVVRYLRYLGYRVKYVQNITDVGHLTDDADEGEDKIEEQARREKTDPMEVAEHYAWSYFDDMDQLGILRANIFPRATGHIPEQIAMVQKLLDKGYAYEVNGNVYFDVSAFSEYGKLSRRNPEEMEAGSRVAVNPEKRNPADFALWKRADENHLMRWNSPWGMGYPGWHIECSAMSMKYLGDTFDIHGGGMENIFPHHECEIAQSEAASGKPFVRYWMHNNMVTVDGTKMGKSLGNFVTLKDALEKFSGVTLRYFVLSSHYRSALDFSNEALSAAEKGLDKLLSTIRNLRNALESAGEDSSFKPPFEIGEYRSRFEEMMNDDFNTPRAIAVLFDLSRAVNSYLNSGDPLHRPFLEETDELFTKLGGEVLGLIPADLMKEAAVPLQGSIEKIIQVAVETRNRLRSAKNFEMADFIRSSLEEAGVQLVDKQDGTEFEIKVK
ncbi:MAG: cysteine--tRNA ligase [Calditrichia bacterium]